MPLAGCGVALELVLLFGFLRPLQIRRHPQQATTFQPLATVLGADASGALHFAVPVVGAFVVFAAAWWWARRCRGGARWLALGGAVLFSLTLIPINPLANQDVYHNIADARTLWVYGDNPTITAPDRHPEDPFFSHVWAWQDYPSVYGPLWYLLAGAPLPVGGAALWPNVIGQKLLTSGFFLVTVVLAMGIAERVRAGTATTAGVLVGWNPLLLFETAGNAHNDIVMVCFALAAVYAAVRRCWLLVFPLLALSVATKYVLVLLGPVLLVWLLRQRNPPWKRALASLGLAALVSAGLYLPFFEGAESIRAVQRESDHITSSPGAVLQVLLVTRFNVAPEHALAVAKRGLTALFLAGYVLVLLRIPRHADAAALVRACTVAVFLLLVIAKWWFWPWYLLWLLPLAAPLARDRVVLVASVFSATAMLMYIPYFWLVYGNWARLQYASVATAFGAPVLLAIMLVLLPRQPRRVSPPEPEVAH